MRLHRFYISDKIGTQKEVTVHSAELVNQLRRVFRLKTADFLIVFDGSGFDFECTIAGFTDDTVTLDVVSVSRSRYMPEREVVLYAAVVKKDTFEWIVEKATELGVTKIIPVSAERSEKKNLNMDRLRKIAVEASEQSGRGTVPTIGEICSPEMALSGGPISRIAFHTEGKPFAQGRPAQDEAISLFIGPEGGWSPSEIDLFHRENVSVVSLGTQILRAETAVVAALSVVMLGQ